MPLLTPPNPTTQLEEAKRRLEDETKAAARQNSMLKSKSVFLVFLWLKADLY